MASQSLWCLRTVARCQTYTDKRWAGYESSNGGSKIYLIQPSRTVQQRGLVVGSDPPLQSQLRRCPVRADRMAQAFNWCHQHHGMPALMESNRVKFIIDIFYRICNKQCIEIFDRSQKPSSQKPSHQ